MVCVYTDLMDCMTEGSPWVQVTLKTHFLIFHTPASSFKRSIEYWLPTKNLGPSGCLPLPGEQCYAVAVAVR
jgi:hypothetical protein